METTAKMDAAVFVENLSLVVGKGDEKKALLRNISLAVPEGSFLSIIGASGCGKSTLLKAMSGIQPVTAGRILLSGHPVETLRQQLPLAVGYLPQFGAFHGDLTVAEILDFAVALRLPSSNGANTSSTSPVSVPFSIKNIGHCRADRCGESPWRRNSSAIPRSSFSTS
jgi:ABC-type multidrug transport system ATPase subunit